MMATPFPHPNPDETTSQSTKPSENDDQVAGYLPLAGEGTNESVKHMAGHPKGTV